MKSMSARLLICALLVTCLLGSFSALAQVAPYPSKPVRIVMPYPPGGSGDFLARLLATRLSSVFPQQFIVENKAGAGGNIGTEFVAKAAPDGYTLLLASDIQFAQNPEMNSTLSYADTDFAPITLAAYIEFVLSVPTALQVNSLPEFIAKSKQDPGKMSYASAGEGSTHHLAMEMFSTLAGLKLVHVPYKGAGQALPDLIGNNVHAMILGVSQALPHIRSGKLKPLAVGSIKRLPALPDTETFSESFPGFEARSWWALYAPKGTPSDVVAKLNAEVVKFIRLPEVQEQLSKAGFEAAGTTPVELGERVRSDRAKWRRVIAASKVKVQ